MPRLKLDQLIDLLNLSGDSENASILTRGIDFARSGLNPHVTLVNQLGFF